MFRGEHATGQSGWRARHAALDPARLQQLGTNPGKRNRPTLCSPDRLPDAMPDLCGALRSELMQTRSAAALPIVRA